MLGGSVSPDMPRGFVYRVAQGGDVEVLRGVAPQGVRVANGCAFSECGSSMYFVDSPVSFIRLVSAATSSPVWKLK